MQQTSTVKLPAFFLRFQTKECILRVNKSDITGENTFNGDLFEIDDNHESSKDKKNLALGSFANLLPVLCPLDHKICISMFFEQCLIFGNFKLLPVGFKSQE